MKETGRRTTGRQVASPAHVFATMADARASLHEAVVSAGMAVLSALLEEERTRLCGPRYAHQAARSATRSGHTDGELGMGGRRVRIARPRVHGTDGREIKLETWANFAASDPLTPRAVEQMVLGVATRKYARSLEPSPLGQAVRGTSKSAVSRRFVAATQERLDAMKSADLGALSLVAIMIDGIHVGEHVVLVALGVDEKSEKHTLGLYEGATENTTACLGLLSDLEARGAVSGRAMLFVIDGSKALSKAIRATFGTRALIQRCQVHKKRNVEEHLPNTAIRRNAGRTISAAYRSKNAARAKRMLNALARQLEKKHPSAAASLREGLDETLTVMGMGLDDRLARTLSTTNPIEFLNGRIRRTTHNVATWTSGNMVLRWLATALFEAQKTFRRLRGHKGMPKLVATLQAHDDGLTRPSVDATVKAA